MTAQSQAWSGEDNVIPLRTTTTLHPTLRASPRNLGFSSTTQTFLASPAANPGNSRRRWSTTRSPLSAPLGEVAASPRVLRHPSRQPTLRQRAPTGSPAHRAKEGLRAPRTRAPGLEHRSERGKGCPGAPFASPSRPTRRPPSLRSVAPARSQPRALLFRDPGPKSLAQGPDHPPPQTTSQLRGRRASPQLPGPHQNVCATRRGGQAAGHPLLPAGSQAQEEEKGRRGVACALGTPSREVPVSEGRRSAGAGGGGGQRQYSPVPQSPS